MVKNHSRSAVSYPPALQDALAWLGAPPPEDPLADLVPLRGHLLALVALDVSPLQLLKILELVQPRVTRTRYGIRLLLLDATLPVARRLRTLAQGMMDVQGALTQGFLRVIREAPAEKLRNLHRTPATLCAHGLASLAQQHETAILIAAPPPLDFWYTARTLYSLIRTGLPLGASMPADAISAEEEMKRMLALAAAQPDGFSAREIVFLSDYLRRHGNLVSIRPETAPPGEEEYWLDKAQHFVPQAYSRRKPPEEDAVTHFSCVELSRMARRHLEFLASGERPERMELPTEATLPDYRNALMRAEQHWSNPPRRQSHRRRHGYRVQVCTHLGQLWQALRGEKPDADVEIELPASDWMILNESPNGYAIMHVAGDLAGVVAGSAIGLRSAGDKPWNICVVRWARSEHAEHIELGLELIAPRAEAVRIARPAAGEPQPPVPALLLPPLPTLERGESLLTARGYFAPGPFTLLTEVEGRVQVTDCTAGELALHTACIEIFEFGRNFEPA